MRARVDAVLKALSPPFDQVDSHTGRPSIAPETWLRALLRHVLYTVRRERWLMEQLDYNRLLRWLVGLNRDEPIWEASTFSQHRERWLAGAIAHACCDPVRAQARARTRWSDEHCTVDGTRIEAWAGQKSCTRQDAAPPAAPPDDPGHPRLDFRGERRPNATHASTTDLAARLYTKATGPAAKRASLGPVRMENRHGLVVDSGVPQATGTAEREAALAMAEAMPGQRRVTLGADKNDDTHDVVCERREWQVTPPVAHKTAGRSSTIAGRTTRHPGDAVSQRKRTCVEELVGWLKPLGLRRQVRHRGMARVGWLCTVAAAVYHLVRMRILAAAA